MDAATLLLLVSGVGVGFGWQPMPDGTPRYEYVVQIEPELLETMADGHAIPIVADVPEHVHPVGRIRVVVGRGEPPRQQLVRRLKPAVSDADAASPSGAVELAQYQGGGDSPYGDRYAAQPPAAAEWNTDGAANPAAPPNGNNDGVLPTGTQLFQGGRLGDTAEKAWNTGVETAEAAAGAIDRVGDGIQEAAQPLRRGIEQGVERVDNRVRDAAGNLGDRTRDLIDELGRPINNLRGAAAGTTENQPPPTAGATANSQWNGVEAPTANPAEAADRHSWNDEGPAPDVATGPQSPAPRLGGAVLPPLATGSVDPRTAAAGASASRDPFANSADPRFRSASNPAGADGRAPITPPDTGGQEPAPFAGLPANWGAGGSPVLPPVGDAATGVRPDAGSPTALNNDGRLPAAGPVVPAVKEPMLQQPANRPLEGVDPREQQAADPSTLAGAPPTDANAAKTPAANAGAAGQGWDGAAAAPANTAAAGGKGNAAVLIAAWVLLTGSVAGNLYLFWSYLDVRQKYRSLVRKTARAVGSRFSAA